MIVSLCFGPQYKRLIECDTLHVNKEAHQLELSLYKDNKHIESVLFQHDPVSIFVMENGKTIERIEFSPTQEPK